MILDVLKEAKKVYIAGAQSRAKTLKGYISFLCPEVCVEAFLVDNYEENDKFIDGISVIKRETQAELNPAFPVFIATKGIYHSQIIEELRKLGMEQIFPVSVDVDNELRNAYVQKQFEIKQIPFVKLEDLSVTETGGECGLTGTVYVAKSVYDKPLQGSYENTFYESEIQVGAALTQERLGEDILTDNVRDNISEKNRQYCELTALYWIWKNRKDDEVVGLAHYRRHFVLPDDWMLRMDEHQVDVILPVPTYVTPNISDNYKQRHDPSDWEYLLNYLKENREEDYIWAQKVFEGTLYSPCNMFIMRREILEELCSWMFPILDEVVAHGGAKEDVYLNRYPGFISERLLTLFFEKNREKYHIVYADKTFIA